MFYAVNRESSYQGKVDVGSDHGGMKVAKRTPTFALACRDASWPSIDTSRTLASFWSTFSAAWNSAHSQLMLCISLASLGCQRFKDENRWPITFTNWPLKSTVVQNPWGINFPSMWGIPYCKQKGSVQLKQKINQNNCKQSSHNYHMSWWKLTTAPISFHTQKWILIWRITL